MNWLNSKSVTVAYELLAKGQSGIGTNLSPELRTYIYTTSMFVPLLDLFNAQLSPERYWCWLRSQEVGVSNWILTSCQSYRVTTGQRCVGRGDYDLTLYHHHHQSDSCITISSNENHVNVSFIVRGEGVHKAQLLKRNDSQSGESNRLRQLEYKRLAARPVCPCQYPCSPCL